MSKPEFSRPFSLEHAKAGAPIATAERGNARFVAYEETADPSCCVIVIEALRNSVGTRRGNGRVNESGAPDNPYDLVMLPIGMCQSKPVFMGDELVTRFGDKFLVEAKHIGDLDEENTWPKSYPVTQMRLEDFDAAIIASGSKECISAGAACVIANAALRHAIDNGYLLDPRELQQTISIKASPEDVQRIMSGDTGRASIQYVPANDPARDVERDLAIAEAAAKAVYNKVYQFGSHRVAYCDLRLDLPAIIASVTGAKDAKEGAQ